MTEYSKKFSPESPEAKPLVDDDGKPVCAPSESEPIRASTPAPPPPQQPEGGEEEREDEEETPPARAA